MQETVRLCRPASAGLICILSFCTVILDHDGNEIIHPPCFHCDDPLLFRQLLTCFYRIVYPVAKQSADIKRFYKIRAADIDSSRKIDMLLAGFLCFISDNDIEKIVACMDIILVVRDLCAKFLRLILVVRDLCAKFLRHLTCGFCSLGTLQHKQVVLHIVIDRPHPFLIF